MVTPRYSVPLTAALLSLCLGCQVPSPGSLPRQGRPPSPRATSGSPPPAVARAGELRRIPQEGLKTRLTGRARLIANPGGPLVSDQGGSLISDQGGALISDQGGAIISNNGGGMFGKTKFWRLHQAGAGLGVYGLAEAEVRLFDAVGRLLVDDAGKPLAATTGPEATFALEAVLPPGNVVARIALWNGGELTAIVAPEGAQAATVELTTASSLGASYVLGLVKGDQRILDRLPRTESERLNRELDIVRGFAQGAFKHDTTTLDSITARLRLRVPAVEQVAEDVRALLLGQARLGAGRLATEVPLAGPLHLAIGRSGRLLVGEQLPGRVRELQADGTLAMVLDKTLGRIRNNAPTLRGLAEGPDGSLYTAVPSARRVYRLPRVGDIQVALGSGEIGRTAPGDPTTMAATPMCVAAGPDGTVWVGEEDHKGQAAPRLLALRPDGRVEAFTPEGASGSFLCLAVAPTGEVYALLGDRRGEEGSLWRYRGSDGWTSLATDLLPGGKGGLCVTATGEVLVSDTGRGRVRRLGPDGRLEPGNVLQPGARIPGSLAAHPDGTLHVADLATNVVWAHPKEGPPRVLAGTTAVFQAGETQAFAINTPVGVTVDGQGHLYIAEEGSHTVRRFDGKTLAVFAGSERASGPGDLGDGGPATQARLRAPRGLAWHEGTLYVLDNGNMRVRAVGPDGTIRTLATGRDLKNDWGLAIGPEGRPWWARSMRGVLARMTAAGGTETVVGTEPPAGPHVGSLVAGLTGLVGPEPASLKMAMPTAVVRDPEGHMVFCDAIGSRIYRLRGGGPGPGTIEVVAGVGLLETLARADALKAAGGLPSEEGIPARDAVLSVPLGLAYDAQGNLYVAEGGDRNLEAMAPLLGGELPFDASVLPGLPPRVRRIAPDGTITTIAGPGGTFFQDPAAEDALYVPTSLVVTPDGRLVITDIGSNLVRILPAGRY